MPTLYEFLKNRDADGWTGLDKLAGEQLGDGQRLDLFFDGPNGEEPWKGMNKDFVKDMYGPDGGMTEEMFKSAEKLGRDLMAMFQQARIDITQFEDIREVMGFDKNSGALSAEELGAYLIAHSMAHKKGFADITDGRGPEALIHTLSATFNLKAFEKPGDQDAAIALGQEVFGDNRPAQSSQDTVGVRVTREGPFR